MAVGHQLHQWATRARRYSVEFISIAGNLASVAALVIAYLTTTGVRLLEVYLVSLVTTLGLALVIREVQTARRATYAEVLAHLHHVIHHTRDTLHAVGGLPEPDFVRDYVRRVLDDLAVACSIATRTNCRASIKVLSVHPNAPSLSTLPPRERPRYLLVRTYARDSINATAKEPEQADFLNENTDLCELFANPHQRCFFENDLPKLHAKGGYRNSHLPTQPFDEWPLPYRSAIVWPIRRLGVESQLHPEHELLGFLCVDSASTRVFVHRYDFEIGALIADALYMYMKANLDGHSTQGGLKHGA